jgi:hypothetical protein
VLAHLHTRQPAPSAYLRFLLYREFGWTLIEVRTIPLAEILELFTAMAADAEYQNRSHPKTK